MPEFNTLPTHPLKSQLHISTPNAHDLPCSCREKVARSAG